MRWFWRLLTLLIIIGFLRAVITSEPKVFISWQGGQNWSQMIRTQMKQLQRLTQDLPASLEVEVRHFWRDFSVNGDGKEV